MTAELVGWTSATVLLITLARQVYVQWQSDDLEGVSRWLFIGQIAASVGFVVYSALVDNWVFVVTNALIGVTSIVGQARFWAGAKRRAATTATTPAKTASPAVARPPSTDRSVRAAGASAKRAARRQPARPPRRG